jgi:DNA polymerase III sliding clamp (beta) subunit (PCNA family)
LEDKTSGTELACSEKGLTLTARYQDQEAFEEIETEHQGDSLLIGFNALYIKEVLETMESESVQIGLLGNSDSMSIESTDADEGHHTIMSMRL